LAVVLPQIRHDSLCRFLGLVEWNRWKQVVYDMEVNDIMEKVTSYDAEIAVDRTECPFDEGPSLLCVVRDGGMRVMEISDCY